jgi:two-component system phosphate regulon response regulator PhoB
MRARILIVDDHPTMREAMRLVLADEGFTVDEAADGARALDLVASDRPDLVLLDLNIPGISGPDLLEALKASRVTSGIPVVVVTAEEEEGRRAALQAGAEDYLTKPFSPRALVLTVEQVLEGSGPTGG